MNPFRRSLPIVAGLLLLGAAGTHATSPAVIYEALLPGTYTIPHARDVVVDDAGCAYLIGSAYEDGHTLDVLVAKLDPQGAHVWTRYVVTSGHSYATGLVLGAMGDVWVTGWTDSDDFPLVNPMDGTRTHRDAFLMKLDAADGEILYSTLLGGDYTDAAQGIALGPGGEIWLTGSTGSTDFPVTEDAYQGEASFPLYFFTDAFLTKLSPSGDEILYSTYFGGQEDDQAQGIAVQSNGDIVIVGNTTAADFPLANALQSAPNELFISKFSADGSTLLFSTYFGGGDIDRFSGLALDAADRLHLVGITRSVDFPTTAGAYQEDFVGAINGCEVPFGGHYNCEDFFVTKLATDGGGILWSTYLGGTTVDEGRAITVDDDGTVYVAGYTSSEADFPPDGLTFDAAFVVCRLDATGSILDFTHAVNSGSANRGNGVALDALGNVYFTGTLGVPASIYVSKLGMGPEPTGVEAGLGRDPAALALGAAHPNPFRPETRVEYVVPDGVGAAGVTLRVYDVAGHLVRELVNARPAGGRYTATWRGDDDRGTAVGSGIYFLRLETAAGAVSRKVVRLRS